MSKEHDVGGVQAAQALDGNAAAGILRELFAFDVTMALITCAGCGAAGQLGEAKVYGGPMGTVLRCMRCESVVVRLARTPEGYWLDMQGARRLFVPEPQP